MKIHNKSPLRCLSIITIRLFWFMFKQRKENTWKSDRSASMWAWRNEKWEKMRVKSRVKTRVTHFSRENLTLHKHHHGLSPNTDSFSVLVSSSCSHNYSNYTIPLSLSPLHDRCIFQTFCASAPILCRRLASPACCFLHTRVEGKIVKILSTSSVSWWTWRNRDHIQIFSPFKLACLARLI